MKGQDGPQHHVTLGGRQQQLSCVQGGERDRQEADLQGFGVVLKGL